MAILTGGDSPASATLIGNDLLGDLPTVRTLPSKRPTHQRPSLELVQRIHTRASKDGALERPRARRWTFLQWQAQTAGLGSYWKISHRQSNGYLFYLFEHYSCAATCVYEGPTYMYALVEGRPTYLGFSFGGQLISY